MSIRRAQREIDSAEFAEWMAFYLWEDEQSDPNRPPSEDELGMKLAAFAAGHL